MRTSNKKGGAAIVAVLIVIMIVAIGSALMVATGKMTIKPNTQAITPEVSSPDVSAEESSEIEESSEESSEVEIPVTVPSALPEISDSYRTISIDGLTCNSAILLNADTNEIVAGLKYDKKMYPASLTKLLTLLVAVENIEDMDATYTFTSEDIDPLIEENASRAGFEVGEEVTMEDLLYAAILPSGADGTVGLANAVAGSEEKFVEMMNAKITELGLSGTQFVNASGLHSKAHYSTVQDIAVITKACLDNDICKKIMTADSYTTSKTEQHENGIELTSFVAMRFNGYWVDCDGDGEADEDTDILGGKTGFTDEAKYTLSTVCERNGVNYICVTSKSTGELISVEDQLMIYEKYLDAENLDDTEDESSEEEESSEDESSEENPED